MMWRRNGANPPERAFHASVARMQLLFPSGSKAMRREKQAKSPSDVDQIELSKFTQSWIVEMHCSRAGNVR
jgi:predicted KAP-like P-loop ATPase